VLTSADRANNTQIICHETSLVASNNKVFNQFTKGFASEVASASVVCAKVIESGVQHCKPTELLSNVAGTPFACSFLCPL
jgi:hypothetical protein